MHCVRRGQDVCALSCHNLQCCRRVLVYRVVPYIHVPLPHRPSCMPSAPKPTPGIGLMQNRVEKLGPYQAVCLCPMRARFDPDRSSLRGGSEPVIRDA